MGWRAVHSIKSGTRGRHRKQTLVCSSRLVRSKGCHVPEGWLSLMQLSHITSTKHLGEASVIPVLTLPTASHNRGMDLGLPGNLDDVLARQIRRYILLPYIWRDQIVLTENSVAHESRNTHAHRLD